MATLITADGRRLRRRPPGNQYLTPFAGAGAPLWTSGDQTDAFGDHTPSGFRLASYTEVYETQPVVASAVNKLVRQTSTLPLKVFERNSDNSRQRVPDHPLADLFDNPCPRRSTVDLIQWIVHPLLVHGNALVYKYRESADAPVTELYPIDWASVSAYAQRGGPVEWWGSTQFGDERFFKAEEVLHFAWQSSGSEIGVSPLKQLGVTLKIEDAAQRHTSNSFKNGVNPSMAVILHPDARYDDETRRMMRESIERTHGGPENQGRVFIAGAGSDVKTLSHSAREAELISVREVSLREICMVYDVKPTVLGDLTHGTYSNVEELNKDLYKQTLRPWLAMIEATLKAQLVRDEQTFQGVFPEFDTSEVLKGDPEARFQSYALQITNGIRTINEVRLLENLPPDPSPEADKLWLPTNNLAPIDEAMKQAALAKVRQDMSLNPPQPTETVKEIMRDPQTNQMTGIRERRSG